MQKYFYTKAETLAFLQGKLRKSKIPQFLFFSVSDWRADPKAILENIRTTFNSHRLAVRSSAWNEVGSRSSLSGHYRSCLDVSNDQRDLTDAIESVTASFDEHPGNQILVQEMVKEVELSGVIVTHDLASGAPYYTLEYDDVSSRTDRITAGAGAYKTIIIHHDAKPSYIESPVIMELLEVTREIEKLWDGRPVDVEFARTRQGDFFLLQARSVPASRNLNPRLAKSLGQALKSIEDFLVEYGRPRPGLAGTKTVLGQMPDWNPAELLGTHPAPLAVSVFRKLITDEVWQQARARMGYRPVDQEPLMVVLAGRPYIDVRKSFNSFLPAGLELSLQNPLIDAWLDRLCCHPEFHDKVEFEVAQTTLDLAFGIRHRQRYAGVLSRQQFRNYSQHLRDLTNQNVSLDESASLPQALSSIHQLEEIQFGCRISAGSPLHRVFHLLQRCREFGTLPFATIARHAFIAEAILRSAVQVGVLKSERLDDFKRSLNTVASRMTHDFSRVMRGRETRERFLRLYGHLRPGSFDIASPRYDQRPDLFRDGHFRRGPDDSKPFVLSSKEYRCLRRSIEEAGLTFSVDEFIQYAAQAVAGREYAKFAFSKPLSDALEGIAKWGESLGLSREELSFLTLDELSAILYSPLVGEAEDYFRELIEVRRSNALETRALRLGHLIRDVRDLYVIHLSSNSPNFVSCGTVEGKTLQLENRTAGTLNLFKKIICLENGDPGFDWIFARRIAGLVTCFGGANSHMAIRCAEMGIPAAIGVGELLFERLTTSESIELNCRDKIVRPIYEAVRAETIYG